MIAMATNKKRVFYRWLIALLIFTIPISVLPASSKALSKEQGAGNTAQLRILETTDLHTNIMPYDYYKDTDQGIDYGLAKTATLIKQARSEVTNSMLFDAGDMIQGTPLANYVAKINPLKENEIHPLFRAMNYLEYDAGILGNHEFNYGLDYLNNVLAGAKFPIVNANVYYADQPEQNYFTPYVIKDKEIIDDQGNSSTVKVGVIGFTPPQIMNWDKDHLTGKVIVKDIVKTAKKFIPKMQEEGAEIIVAIAHSGCDITVSGQELAEDAVYDLTKVNGIDVMLFGHAHLVFPGDGSFDHLEGINNTTGHIHGVPSVEAGFWGNHLGVLDLSLIQDKNGKWSVDKETSKSTTRPVTVDTPLDNQIVNDVKAYHKATLAYVRGRIGETEIPMYSYFARVMDNASVEIVNMAQVEYAKNWIDTKAPELKNIPILSAAAPYKGGRGGVSDFTNIPKGELSIKSANDLYLFDNTVKAVKLTGAQVKEWLEFAASSFLTVDPNKKEPQEILDYDFRPYNFDAIDGISYQIDITQPRRYDWEKGTLENPEAHRITNFMMLDGTPIKDDQPFIVVTNNYRAGGGGNFPGIKDAEIVIDSQDENREILMEYIRKHGTINPVPDHNWSIAPIDGDVTLIFQSAPDGKHYVDQLPMIKALGTSISKNGYETYQLLVDKQEKPGKDPVDKDKDKDKEHVATKPPKKDGGADNKPKENKKQQKLKETMNNQENGSKTDGEKLPNTATNTFNFLLIGLLLVVGGFIFFVIQKRKTHV